MSFETERYQLFGVADHFLRWVVYPNLWVAAGITSLVGFVQQSLGLPLDGRPYALIFAITLIPYILDRVVDTIVQPKTNPTYQQLFQQAGIWFLLGLAVTVTLVLIIQAPVAVRWTSCGAVVPILYGLPLFPSLKSHSPLGATRSRYRLKDIPGAKAWIVCLTVTYGVMAVPIAYASSGMDREVILTGLFLVMFIGTNSHVFDIRDLESDRQTGVKTMPVLVGVGGTRVILTALNAVMVAILMSAWLQGVAAPSPQVVLTGTVISISYLWVLTPETPGKAYDFWIDGCLFLPLIVQVLT